MQILKNCHSDFFSICFFILGIFIPAFSQEYHFDYNKDLKECYHLATHLRLDECRICIKKLKVSQPHNLSVIHIENYIDFFEIFVKEEKDYFISARDRKNSRIKLLESGPKNSPYYKFAKAEVILQWAIARLKFDEKMTAASEVYEAYRLLEQNKKDFPEFHDHHKSLSVIYAVAESIPSWIRKLAGINGSMQLAHNSMEQIVKTAEDSDYFFRQEVGAIYAYMLYYQFNQKDKALTVFDRFSLDHRSNPLAAFLKASLYMRSGRNEDCLRVLNERARGKQYSDFYYLDFIRGKSLLYKLDVAALDDLNLFVNEFKGNNYIKEAWQKIAWYRLVVEDNEKMYEYTIDRAGRRGAKIIDEDLQADAEAKARSIPNKTLLKARLLSDGGYFDRALDLLIKDSKDFRENNDNSVEYYYRLGRVYQQLGKNEKALENFAICLEKGKNSKMYFSCAASLQTGFIYEEKKDTEKAKAAFNQCLRMHPRDYKESLHQKAKSGLQRLK